MKRLFIFLIFLPIYPQLDKSTQEKVGKIYDRVRRNAIIMDAPAIVEIPADENCVAAQNFQYDRLSYARKYTSAKPKKSECKTEDLTKQD